ncbi:MAG: type II toxin-antitoxin system Phd/YefM family antitoxin [Terriglobales bacterium]
MPEHAWTVAQAKSKFSEVIEKATHEGPQTITRNGRRAAVLVAAHEWDRKTKRKGTLADFFAASPLRGSGLNLQHLPIRLRPIRSKSKP